MARGRSWPKADLDRWVEQWWLSELTSLEFVKAEALPISARTLRSHGERHFGEVLCELQELRALGLANRPVAAEANSAPGCQVAESTSAPSPEPTPSRLEKKSKPEPFIFDFAAEDDPPAVEDGAPDSSLESRQVASSENSPEPRSPQLSEFPEPVRHVANQQSSGPFLFEVEAW
jgi:hypothetical protein